MDQQVVITLNSWASAQPWIAYVTVLIAERGFFLLPLAIGLLWIWPGRVPSRRLAVLACAFSFVLALVLMLSLGHSIYRPQPFVELPITPLLAHTPETSFPSDHTLLGVSLVGPLLTRQRGSGIWLVLWALVVGLARVAAGVHYPSDIIGSIALAAVPIILGVLLSQFSYAQLYFVHKVINRDTLLRDHNK